MLHAIFITVYYNKAIEEDPNPFQTLTTHWWWQHFPSYHGGVAGLVCTILHSHHSTLDSTLWLLQFYCI